MKCSCHKSRSWEVVILQEGGSWELATNNAFFGCHLPKDRYSAGALDVRLGAPNHQRSSLESPAAARRRADNSLPFTSRGALIVIVIVSPRPPTKQHYPGTRYLSQISIHVSCSSLLSSKSRRHGRQIFLLAHNFFSQASTLNKLISQPLTKFSGKLVQIGTAFDE